MMREMGITGIRLVFDVFANGQKVIANLDVAGATLDVAGATGGALAAYEQCFAVNASNGMLTLEFTPTKGDAIVSAIEVQ